VGTGSHEHAFFRDDNASVYHYLEATRSTAYDASIKPLQQRKDRRGAWLALLDNTLVTTNARPKSRSKRQSYTPELGSVKATSRLNPFSPSTGTPTYLWRHVMSTSSANSLTNSQELASYLMPSKTTMQDSRVPFC
jgi:hypothetical protein